MSEPPAHRRRPRYSGKNPRRFDQKYKEHDPAQYPDVVAKVLASGKTPAGMHRPIMVEEVMAVLRPAPGDFVADGTLGYGGHAEEFLRRVQPGGKLLGLDADPRELPRTEQRLRALGFGPETLTVQRSNFAGLSRILGAAGVKANVIFADLGVSSMQIDDPARGFSVKGAGPLDMRMNPERGQPASEFLRKISANDLAELLRENADEPMAEPLSQALAGRPFATTSALRGAIEAAAGRLREEERELTVRRVFQALRIAVNDEFSALETLLRLLPECLAPGGRAGILTFHSGEDRRVKKAFEEGLRGGVYVEIAHEVIRAAPAERHANPRSTSAKLRWALRSTQSGEEARISPA